MLAVALDVEFDALLENDDVEFQLSMFNPSKSLNAWFSSSRLGISVFPLMPFSNRALSRHSASIEYSSEELNLRFNLGPIPVPLNSLEMLVGLLGSGVVCDPQPDRLSSVFSSSLRFNLWIRDS